MLLSRTYSAAGAGPVPSAQYGETLTTLFNSPNVSVGKFRCPREHPLFRDSGPIRSFVLVFPRTAGYVQFEGERPFFVSPLISPFYNLGQRYVRTPENVGGDRSDWIAIHDSNWVAELTREFDPGLQDGGPCPLRLRFARTTPRTYARQRTLFAALAANEPPEAALVEESVLSLFREALAAGYHDAGSPARTRRGDAALFSELLLAVHASYRQGVSLRSLAARFGISAPHVTRLFRTYHGTSVHRTIVELRLRDSLEWLRDPRVDLTSLAMELGFSSHSHFTTAFRQAFGTPPAHARTQLSQHRQDEWGERLVHTKFHRR